MIFDGGFLLIFMAVALMTSKPVEKLVAHRRYERSLVEPFAAALIDAFPAPSPEPSLVVLVALADEALSRDPLIAGCAAVAQAYEEARREP